MSVITVILIPILFAMLMVGLDELYEYRLVRELSSLPVEDKINYLHELISTNRYYVDHSHEYSSEARCVFTKHLCIIKNCITWKHLKGVNLGEIRKFNLVNLKNVTYNIMFGIAETNKCYVEFIFVLTNAHPAIFTLSCTKKEAKRIVKLFKQVITPAISK